MQDARSFPLPHPLKDFAHSITSSGRSGQLFGPHYMDHWDAWYNKTFMLAFSGAAVEGEKSMS